MKTQFKDIRLRQDSLNMIATCNQIIGEYLAASLRLTLRQLYYQFVARDLFPEDRKWRQVPGTNRWIRDPSGTKNAEPNYKWLSSILSDGRLAGLIDWSAIEDRGRQPKTPNEFADLSELIETAVRSYRLPRWEGQDAASGTGTAGGQNRNDFEMGAVGNTGTIVPLNARFDDMIIEARAWTASQVRNYYNQAKGRMVPNVV